MRDSLDFLQLTDKVVVVTGASSGIGAATARAAALSGARVALIARRESTLLALAAELAGEGHLAIPHDVRDHAATPGVLARVAAEMGKIDGLVHAAGVHQTAPLRTIDPARVADLFDANLVSALTLAKALRAKTVRGASPSIVFLSSAVGLVGQAGVSAYSASKGAITAVTRSLALELARETIRVNCVAPGIVETPLTSGIREAVGGEGWQRITEAHPLGIGTPEDVARSILFLLSPASGWITGTTLVVDGGYTAQ